MFIFALGQSALLQTWTPSSRSHLHKAEGTVGYEEKFLSVAGQSMQNSIRLVPSENEFICKAKKNKLNCWCFCSRAQTKPKDVKGSLTEIFHNPFVHVSFEVNHADCFLWIKRQWMFFTICSEHFFDPYYEISLNYSHLGRKTPIIWKWLMTCQFAYFQRRNYDEVVGVLYNWKPSTPEPRGKAVIVLRSTRESPLQTFPELSKFLSVQPMKHATQI